MSSLLDAKIKAAAEKAAASLELWDQKHIPIRIDGKVIWCSTDVPSDIQKKLDILPEKEQGVPAKRPHQIKSRLSDEEMESLQILLQASGLSQAEYIRGMVLHGHVSITQTSLIDQEALETLTYISANLGKIGGMLRQTIIVNKEFAVLTAEDKDNLETQLRSLRQLQSYIQRLAEDIYGHL